MDKYVEGMKAGAKPFEENLNKIVDSVKKNNKEISNISNNINSLQESMNDIIDVIAEEDPLNRKELLENLKNKKKENVKPENFEIFVVYDKENTEIADQIRESLNNNGNAASMLLEADFKRNNRMSDYVIHLESHGNMDSDAKIMFNGNGCIIEQCGKHLYTRFEDINLRNDEEWDCFKDTYRSIMNAEIERNTSLTQTISTVDNIIKEKKKRESSFFDFFDNLQDFWSKVDEIIYDKIEDLPYPLPLLLGLTGQVLTLLLGALTMVLSIPVGITQTLIAERINSLDKRDAMVIRKVQKDILKVKIVECIRNEQLRGMF